MMLLCFHHFVEHPLQVGEELEALVVMPEWCETCRL
jgi:hypothetical protein